MEWLNIAYSLLCLALMAFGVYTLIPVLKTKAPAVYLYPALFSKLFFTVVMMLIFQFHYRGGDTIVFAWEFNALTEILLSDPQEYIRLMTHNGTFLMGSHYYSDDIRSWLFIRISHPIYLLTGNNFYTSSIGFSLLLFLSAYQLCHTIVIRFQVKPLLVVVAFFFFPSVAFWSSGIYKETIVLAMLFFILDRLLNGFSAFRNWYIIPIVLIFAYLSLFIKFYYFIPLMLFTSVYLLVRYASARWNLSLTSSLLLILVLIVVLAVPGSQLHYTLHPEYFARSIWVNYFVTIQNSNPGTYFTLEHIGPHGIDLLKTLPEAILQGLFAPLPSMIRNPLTLLSAIENYTLMLLTIVAVPSFFKLHKEQKILVVCISLFILSTVAILAMASPNPGLLARYKVIVLPFLCLIALRGAASKFEFTISNLQRRHQK